MEVSIWLIVIVISYQSAWSCLPGRRTNELPSPRTTDAYVIPDKFRTPSPETPSEHTTPYLTNTKDPLISSTEGTSVFQYLTSTLSFFFDVTTYPPTSENESTEGLDLDTSTSDYAEYATTVDRETVGETDSSLTTVLLTTMSDTMQSTLNTVVDISATTETVLTTEGVDRLFPSTIGVNMDWGITHSQGYLREGEATDTHSCEDVREVPEEFRDPDVIYRYGIHESYQKYTEAYGIPIYGTLNVTDEGLKRACYVVRMMLASRYDIRNAMYKLYVRVALLGDVEQQTDIWDYKHLDSDYWDARARGVGATLSVPVCSAGDDNMRCKTGSRYATQDILIHEFAHGVHQLGANYVIPRFYQRLQTAYNNAMELGKYTNKYMAQNSNEYFAQGAQMYFDSYETNSYRYRINGSSVTLDSAETLRMYDPALVDLLDETFSCPNQMIYRCQYRGSCSVSNYEQVKRSDEMYTSGCTRDRTATGLSTVERCAAMACDRNVTAFVHYGSVCRTLKCRSSDKEDLQLAEVTGSFGFNIYRRAQWDVMDLSKEEAQDIEQLCTSPVGVPGRCEVAIETRTQCGPLAQTRPQCVARGCCFSDNQCFYSILAGCIDKDRKCPKFAFIGDCDRNPGLMHRLCPLSCDLCVHPSPYSQVELENMCQDHNIDCVEKMDARKCTFQRNIDACPITCGACSLESNTAEEQDVTAIFDN